MTGGFTKLSSSIIHSTIWRAEDHIRIVWITMLAMSDADGYVMASLPGLADAARVTVQKCEDAIENLSSPDKYSRTRDFDGRRIEQIDGGWIILNYKKHRQSISKDDEREKNRIRQERYRENNNAVSQPVTPCHAMSRHVTANNDMQKQIQIQKQIQNKKEKEHIDQNVNVEIEINKGEFDSQSGLIKEIASEIRKYFPNYPTESALNTSLALRLPAEKIIRAGGNWKALVEKCAISFSGPISFGGRDQLRKSLANWFCNEADGTFKPNRPQNGQSKTTLQPTETTSDKLAKYSRKIENDSPIKLTDLADVLAVAVADSVKIPATIIAWIQRCGRAGNPMLDVSHDYKIIAEYSEGFELRPSQIERGIPETIGPDEIRELINGIGKKF